MSKRHDLALVKAMVYPQINYVTGTYGFNIISNAIDLSYLLGSKNMAEAQKQIIHQINNQVITDFFYDKRQPIVFSKPDEVYETYLKGLAQIDPQKTLVNFLDERVCEPYYEQFAKEHYGWITEPRYTGSKDTSAASPFSKTLASMNVPIESRTVPTNPIERLRMSMNARGLEVDEEKLNTIMKENELRQTIKLGEKNQEKLNEKSEEMIEHSISCEQLFATSSLMDLSDTKLPKRTIETNNQTPHSKKSKLADSFHNASSATSTYHKMLEELNGGLNVNPFCNLVPTSSFAETQAALSAQVITDINMETQSSEECEMNLA